MHGPTTDSGLIDADANGLPAMADIGEGSDGWRVTTSRDEMSDVKRCLVREPIEKLWRQFILYQWPSRTRRWVLGPSF